MKLKLIANAQRKTWSILNATLPEGVALPAGGDKVGASATLATVTMEQEKELLLRFDEKEIETFLNASATRSGV